VADPLFSSIFASELQERLHWFSRLRWLAAAALLAAGLAGPRFGLTGAWPALAGLAVLVAAYNLMFTIAFRLGDQVSEEGGGSAYVNLRNVAIAEMVLDLGAIMMAAHFTGGLRSPLLIFLAFHMAVGTIMVETRIMYAMAGLTSLGVLLMYTFEVREVVPFEPIAPGAEFRLNLVAIVIAMFVLTYLTGSVTRSIKQRSIERYLANQQLRERTEELQALLREIQDLERRKSHYMRISAHQLRSPLGTLKTSLQVLSDGYVDPSTERGRKLIAGASERADGLLAIVNDLLELAKVREGLDKAPWAQQVNLGQLLADVIDSLSTFAEEQDVTLEMELKGEAILAWAVPPDLVYALENLIHNAIKYSKQDGGKVRAVLASNFSEATVEVEDEGIGIPDELLDRIFLEFERAPNAKAHVKDGTGLGLAIVKAVIDAHGGRIEVESREGTGTVFRLTFPLESCPVDTGESVTRR
jgi:signal transduction histidine kinase